MAGWYPPIPLTSGRGPYPGRGLTAVARLTGLEPATPGVTGRYSNQLSYNRPLPTKDKPRRDRVLMRRVAWRQAADWAPSAKSFLNLAIFPAQPEKGVKIATILSHSRPALANLFAQPDLIPLPRHVNRAFYQ